MKNEMDKVHEHLNRLSSRVDEFETKLNTVRSDQNQQAAEINKIRDSITNLSISKTMTDEEACNEITLRLVKKDFLLISGLPESTYDNRSDRVRADTESIRQLACSLGVADLDIENATRVGRIDARKPRLLRFKCKDDKQRTTLLKQSKMLNKSDVFKAVFIFRDRTLLQRQMDKRLREDLSKKRAAGLDVMIRNGRVVPKDAPRQNFR